MSDEGHDEFFRQIPRRDAEALKEKSRLLVERVGGVRKAAEILDLAPSRVSEAIDIHHLGRWLNLMHVAELECASSAPIVTTELARLHGLAVEKLANGKPETMPEMLSNIITSSGKVESLLALSSADNVISLQEAKALDLPVDEAIETLMRLQNALHRLKAGAA